jgi:alkanesulfonate monooxygenase SsuD/methylene tetrahydromethanopterin reductase-like flavin-dependent oxidoreductase (luciferase family)
VRLAEDVITLDLVSKGRVILGVGIGYQAADFRAFNVPMEHRVSLFEESVDILRKCWSGEPFSHRGQHYTLEDVQIRPRPFQQPSPPLWIGASVPAAVRRAGALADAFVATPSTSLQNVMRQVDAYKEAAQKAGRSPRVILMRDAWVARSREEAEAVYGPEVMTAYQYYWQNRLAEFRNIPEGTEFSLANLAPDRLIVGDAETCVREFHRWKDATSADYFLLRLRHAHSGGPPHAKLVGDSVLPHCR